MTCLPILLTLLLALTEPVSASAYRNEQFGFDLSVPGGMKICTTPAPGPNHGFAAPLNGSGCRDLFSKPRIKLFAAYNVPYGATTAAQLAPSVCGVSGGAETAGFSGRDMVYASLPATFDGLMEKTYFFLHKTREIDPTGWVVVQLIAYDRFRVSESDVDLLKRLLTTLRWK